MSNHHHHLADGGVLFHSHTAERFHHHEEIGGEFTGPADHEHEPRMERPRPGDYEFPLWEAHEHQHLVAILDQMFRGLAK